MRALVQSQFETGEFPLTQKNRTPYSMEHVGGDVLGLPTYHHYANWSDPDSHEDHGRVLDMVVTMFGGMVVYAFHVPASEEADATLSYIFDVHGPADYPNDPWVMANAFLQAEAWRKSREIAKEKIQCIVGRIGRDQGYYLREGTTLRIGKLQPSKAEWVQEIEKIGAARPDAKQLARLIKALKSLSNEGKFDEIDTAFSTVKISSLSLEVLIGLLRTTYHCRDRLETWNAFLNTARSEIASRGLSAKEAFVGLY